jgi:hypothetical protein
MKARLIYGAVIASVTLSGCEATRTGLRINPSIADRSAVSLVGREGTIGTLFVWSNDVNAGMITPKGDMCMQRAMSMRTTQVNAEASTDLSAALLKMAENTSAQGDAGGSNTAALALAIGQAAISLSTTTERTSMLDIGFFYICQLEANGAINENQAAMLAQQLIRDTAMMTPVSGTVPNAQSRPDPIQLRPIENVPAPPPPPESAPATENKPAPSPDPQTGTQPPQPTPEAPQVEAPAAEGEAKAG